MISIDNEKVFDNDEPWIPLILKDVFDGLKYEVLLDDEDNAYYDISTEPYSTYDIPDITTGVIYHAYIYNGTFYITPTATPEGTIYATECFIATGNTVIMKLEGNLEVDTVVDTISLNIYDHLFDAFIYVDVTVTKIDTNFFKIEFIAPISGEFIAIIKIGDTTHLVKQLRVEQYSTRELNNIVDKAKEELSKTNYETFV